MGETFAAAPEQAQARERLEFWPGQLAGEGSRHKAPSRSGPMGGATVYSPTMRAVKIRRAGGARRGPHDRGCGRRPRRLTTSGSSTCGPRRSTSPRSLHHGGRATDIQTRSPLPFSPWPRDGGGGWWHAFSVQRVTRVQSRGIASWPRSPGAVSPSRPRRRSQETFAIPDRMSFKEAGAFPIAYISSDVAIRWQGRLEAGETLLVLGRGRRRPHRRRDRQGHGRPRDRWRRARPRSPAREGPRRRRPREHATENLTERVMALTGDQGADVCFYPVGGATWLTRRSPYSAWGCRTSCSRAVGRRAADPRNRLRGGTAPRSGAHCATTADQVPQKLRRPRGGAACLVPRGQASSRASRTGCRSSGASRQSSSSPTARLHGKIVVRAGPRRRLTRHGDPRRGTRPARRRRHHRQPAAP